MLDNQENNQLLMATFSQTRRRIRLLKQCFRLRHLSWVQLSAAIF